MELLLLGIDAGTERIIEVMDMPNLKAVLKENHSLDICEDVWSRGWSEMLSGKHGMDTGAFYAKPKLDGTRNITLDFSTYDYINNKEVLPLWEMINKSGKSVGFMNVPTTKFAPEVNGFFVSGAGGGLAGVEGLPKEFCYPKDIASELTDMGYIIDTRLLSSRIKDMDQWLDTLKEMMKKRTEAYLHLNRRFQVDIGFITYVGTQRMQYLAMSEIEDIIEQRGLPKNILQEKIKELFHFLDDLIGELLGEINPNHVMVVSDHGQCKYLYDVNVDYFLQDLGLSNMELKIRDKAFGMYYVSGIYINDERFESIVEECDKAELIKDIIDAFHSTAEAKRYHLKAYEYKAKYKEKQFADLLPDIWIDAPKTMFFNTYAPQFVSENKAYGPVLGLKSVCNEMNTGIKGEKALLYTNIAGNHLSSNLTAVYELVQAYLKWEK